LRIKLIFLSFLLIILSSCASTDFRDSNNELLTAENSVIVYGYIEDISDLTFIKQSPTFDYDLIEAYTSGDCFVLKKPIPEGSELKLLKYSTFSHNFFTGSSNSSQNFYSMAGVDLKLTGIKLFYFCLTNEDLTNKRHEQEALEYALDKYYKTEFNDILFQRLGELKK